MKPVVDAVEEEFSGRMEVLRVDIHTEAGRVIANELDFQYTPTFIFFDETGNELWREVGGLTTTRIRDWLGENQSD